MASGELSLVKLRQRIEGRPTPEPVAAPETADEPEPATRPAEERYPVPLLLVYALINFIGLVAVLRFFEYGRIRFITVPPGRAGKDAKHD